MASNSSPPETKNFWKTTGALAILVAVIGVIGTLLTVGKGHRSANTIPTPSTNTTASGQPSLTPSPSSPASTGHGGVSGAPASPRPRLTLPVNTTTAPVITTPAPVVTTPSAAITTPSGPRNSLQEKAAPVNGCNTYGEQCDGNPIYVNVPPPNYDYRTWPKLTTVANGTILTARCWETGGTTWNYAILQSPPDLGPNPYESNIYFDVLAPTGQWGWIPDTYFARDKQGKLGLPACSTLSQ